LNPGTEVPANTTVLRFEEAKEAGKKTVYFLLGDEKAYLLKSKGRTEFAYAGKNDESR